MAPCVGDRCEQYDLDQDDDSLDALDEDDFDDDPSGADFGLCTLCTAPLRVGESEGLCYHCEIEERWGDADPRDHGAEQ